MPIETSAIALTRRTLDPGVTGGNRRNQPTPDSTSSRCGSAGKGASNSALARVCAFKSLRHGGCPPRGAVEAKTLQRLVDFLKSLLAEVGDRQELLGRTVEQVADREDADR